MLYRSIIQIHFIPKNSFYAKKDGELVPNLFFEEIVEILMLNQLNHIHHKENTNIRLVHFKMFF